ncbi:MAG: HEPN domain-containing protein [Thermodesulfobacteriota bacterium]
MTSLTLARSYLVKATKRLKILDVLLGEEAYSDVVREAQEIVELAQKAMLRHRGIDPPKWHDVGPILLEHADRFTDLHPDQLARLARISRWLRKERELSFYGDIDFLPTEAYSLDDAQRAMADARFTVAIASGLIPSPPCAS